MESKRISVLHGNADKTKKMNHRDTKAQRRGLRDPADFSCRQASGKIRRMIYLKREKEKDGCINIPQIK